MSNFTALRSVRAALIHVDGRTDVYDKTNWRTYVPKSYISLLQFLPSFLPVSANVFKIIGEFTVPSNLFCNFPHSSEGCQLQVHTVATWPFFCVLGSLL